MNHFSRLFLALQQIRKDESGQDLIEYALIACMMALGAVSSLKNVSSGVAGFFTSLGSTITTSI